MADKTYRVLDNLIHDGKAYGPELDDDTITMDEKAGDALVAAGVLKDGKPARTEKAGDKAGEKAPAKT